MTEEKRQKKTTGRIPRKLKKLQAKSNPVKTPKEKKTKLLKKKVINKPYLKIAIPKLSRDVIRVKRYLHIQKLLNGSWANYMNMKAALIEANIISDKAKGQKIDTIIDQHLKLFKFVGLKTTEPELTEKILQLQAKRKSANKHYENNNNVSILRSVVDRKDAKNKKKKPHPEKSISYKWKRREVFVEEISSKTKEDIVMDIEVTDDNYFFINKAYGEISNNVFVLDYWTMKKALFKAEIIHPHTKQKSQLVEQYIVFFSFIGFNVSGNELINKMGEYDKIQEKKFREAEETKEAVLKSAEEKLKQEKEALMSFDDKLNLMYRYLNYGKELKRAKLSDFIQILVEWKKIIEGLCFNEIQYHRQKEVDLMITIFFAPQQKLIETFLDNLNEMIDTLSSLREVKRPKEEKGKIIELIKKVKEEKKPQIKQAV